MKIEDLDWRCGSVRMTIHQQAVEMYMDLRRDLSRVSRKRLRKQVRQQRKTYNPFGNDDSEAYQEFVTAQDAP